MSRLIIVLFVATTLPMLAFAFTISSYFGGANRIAEENSERRSIAVPVDGTTVELGEISAGETKFSMLYVEKPVKIEFLVKDLDQQQLDPDKSVFVSESTRGILNSGQVVGPVGKFLRLRIKNRHSSTVSFKLAVQPRN